MKVSGYEFDAPPEPPDAEMRTAPDGDDEDKRDEEPPEEPGYGHGV
jgi:hypothetical protein